MRLHLNRKGSALLTVLIIVILVPIIVFGLTAAISSSLMRYTTQNRSLKALYLAQAGIHRAIYNIRSTGSPGSPGTPFTDTVAGDTIAVTMTAQSGSSYQFQSIGTSVSASYPTQIVRKASAQYNYNTNNISLCVDGDGSGMPPLCGKIWWPFSEGSGTTTGSAPYQGTLTPSGATGPAWVPDRVPVAGKALSFNSGATHNYVTVPDSSGLDLTTAGTIMAWIKIPSATPVAQDGTGIVHKGNSSTDEPYGLIIRRQNANFRYIRFVLRSSNNGTQRVVTGGTNLQYNAWMHVAATWGSGGLKVYLNGIQDGVAATVYSSYANAGLLTIGTLRTGSATTRFRGMIDEVYLYPCQKTATEILDYYNATKP